MRNELIESQIFEKVNYTLTPLEKGEYENCLFLSCDFSNSDFSSFFKLNLKKTGFKNFSLKEVDFAESNLTSAVFDNCDLFDAKFDNTILEKADFRTAVNYALDLEKNTMKGARFSKEGIIGLLSKYKLDVQ